jgi:hypothetical protein
MLPPVLVVPPAAVLPPAALPPPVLEPALPRLPPVVVPPDELLLTVLPPLGLLFPPAGDSVLEVEGLPPLALLPPAAVLEEVVPPVALVLAAAVVPPAALVLTAALVPPVMVPPDPVVPPVCVLLFAASQEARTNNPNATLKAFIRFLFIGGVEAQAVIEPDSRTNVPRGRDPSRKEPSSLSSFRGVHL